MSKRINTVTIKGELIYDPILKSTHNGVFVSNNILKVPSDVEGKFEDINIVVWGPYAKDLCNSLKKGELVTVTGYLKTNTIKDRDNENALKKIIEIIVEDYST